MAEEERLTKAERRKRKREAQRRKAAEQSRRRLRRRILTGLGTLAVLALVGAVLWQAFSGGSELAEPVALTADEVREARATASCELVDRVVEFPSTRHIPSRDQAPPLEQLYPRVRPPHGGPHLETPHPLIVDGSDRQLDELTTTHNLEHGAVIVWYDPEAVDDETIAAMESWSETLNDSGFANIQGGSGLFVSPYTDPGLPEGTAVAMRAWGVAMDCAAWNRTAADAFVLQYYGTHGIAPEAATFALYPEDTIVWEGNPLPNTFQPGGEAPGDTTNPDGATTTPEPEPTATP